MILMNEFEYFVGNLCVNGLAGSAKVVKLNLEPIIDVLMKFIIFITILFCSCFLL